MLSREERQEIEAKMPHYEDTMALSLDALKTVQRHRGWVDSEGLADCAAILGVSVTTLEGVATFYNLLFRHPVGRHVVLVCDSISCWVCGQGEVSEQLSKTLNIKPGETTADKRFTLLPVNCLGACDGAPAMMIDYELHRNMTPERIDEVLAKYE